MVGIHLCGLISLYSFANKEWQVCRKLQRMRKPINEVEPYCWVVYLKVSIAQKPDVMEQIRVHIWIQRPQIS